MTREVTGDVGAGRRLTDHNDCLHQVVACLAALAGPGGTQLVRYSFNFLGGPTSRVETLDASGTVRGSVNYLDSLGNVKVQYYDYAAQVGAPAVNFIEPQAYEHFAPVKQSPGPTYEPREPGYARPPQAREHFEPVEPTPEPTYEPREPVDDAPKSTLDVTEHSYDAPHPAQEGPDPAQDAPSPAQVALDPAQDTPDPAQEAPDYVQEVAEPIQNAPESAQDVSEPAQGTPEPPHGTSAPTSSTTPEPDTGAAVSLGAAEPYKETPQPRQDATEAPADIFKSFGQRLRALARPSYAFPPRRAARRFRNKRALVASNSIFPQASRFPYQPLALAHAAVLPAATAYAGVPLATTYAAAAPAAARDATLLQVVHNPGHATSYRVD